MGWQRQHRRRARRPFAPQAGRQPFATTLRRHGAWCGVPDGQRLMAASTRYGIRMRLLAAHAVVVLVGIATTSVFAAVVGPPMFRRLMRTPRGADPFRGDPYEHAFRDATAMSVSIALGVSALAALTLSWYLSRRVHRSATELSGAATAIANGRYDIRVSPPRLGKEFDAITDAFNRMAQQLGAVEDTRRQLLADLAHEIRTPVSVLEASMEALEERWQRRSNGRHRCRHGGCRWTP